MTVQAQDGWVTILEYAAHRGVSKQRVGQAIREYKIPTSSDHPRRLDPRVADMLWNASAKQAPRAGVAGPVEHPTATQSSSRATHVAGVVDLADARLRKEAAQADLAELKVAQERGQLVDVRRASDAWFAAIRAIRDRVRAIPPRVAPDFAASGDVDAIRRQLEREIDEALQAASVDLRTLAEAA